MDGKGGTCARHARLDAVQEHVPSSSCSRVVLIPGVASATPERRGEKLERHGRARVGRATK